MELRAALARCSSDPAATGLVEGVREGGPVLLHPAARVELLPGAAGPSRAVA